MVAAAAVIVAFQLFVPPIVGLADQGDFQRIIGRFGYRAERSGLATLFIERKYVRDANSRVRDWEQFSSEYFFVAAAVGLNPAASRDGKLDLRVMGFIHAIAFLAAFARLLQVSRGVRGRVLVWIAMLLILTDVAYVAYCNSFFAEPASLIFFVLLAAESIDIAQRGFATRGNLLRWSLWAILFVLAKPANAAPGFLLALFALRFRASAGRAALFASAAIVATCVVAIATTPKEVRNANTYNLVFMSVLPESRNPAADLQALGLDWRLQDFSRSGAFTPETMYPQMEARGDIGRVVTDATVLRFYLARPTRFWRHIQVMLPVAMHLRDWYGNYGPETGYPPATRTRAFAAWSDLHAVVLRRIPKVVLLSLLAPAAMVLMRRKRELWMELYALLGLCAVTAFLTAIFGAHWDDIKHLFSFNLMVDAFLVTTIGWVFQRLQRARRI